jgi:hypothetical protein
MGIGPPTWFDTAMPGLSLCFDYDRDVPELQAIMATARRTQWTVDEIDWDRPSRPGDYTRILEFQGVMRSEYVRALGPDAHERLARQLVAFDFSQILHGEQGAMMLAGQLTNCVADLDARLFAAGQVRDEARHVEAVRSLVKRIGPVYPCSPRLEETLEGLLRSSIWPKQVLGLQLFLEARALLSFRENLLFVDDPVFRDVILRIERDEAQHVAFGIRYMSEGLRGLSLEERTELVEFAQWLDKNVWRMVDSMEYRLPFEEAGLSFDEFAATFRASSPYNLMVRSSSRRRVDDMMRRFNAWFRRVLDRTGIIDEARTLGLADWADAPVEGASELEDELLPWAEEPA